MSRVKTGPRFDTVREVVCERRDAESALGRDIVNRFYLRSIEGGCVSSDGRADVMCIHPTRSSVRLIATSQVRCDSCQSTHSGRMNEVVELCNEWTPFVACLWRPASRRGGASRGALADTDLMHLALPLSTPTLAIDHNTTLFCVTVAHAPAASIISDDGNTQLPLVTKAEQLRLAALFGGVALAPASNLNFICSTTSE